MENMFGMDVKVSVFDEVALEEGCSPITKIHKYTLSNGWMEVDVIDYGATITSIRVPDREGNMADVVLGYDNMKGYMATMNNPYFGATIGRYANRIAGGKFVLDDVLYILSRNEEDKTLHGGVVGFNRKLWKASIDNEGLVLELTSPHLDQGFPGELQVKARFALTKTNALFISYSATSDRPTAINMCNHAYFNLAGHDAGAEKLYEHYLMVNATNFTPNDDNMIPKGKLQDVIDTPLDFNLSQNLGQAIAKTGSSNGIDINFCVNGPTFGKKLVASLEHPSTGRRMVVHSNQPGVQLYTGNCVQVKEGKGKGRVGYGKHSGLCLETQIYPNSINEKHFPSSVVRPPAKYVHTVSYEFSTYELPPPPPPELEAASEASLNKVESATDIFDTTSPAQRECVGKVSETDPPECHTDNVTLANFTPGSKWIDKSLEYEPYSEIKPYPDCHEDEFHTVLKQCQKLCRVSEPRHWSIKYISPKQDSVMNIITDTDLAMSRYKF